MNPFQRAREEAIRVREILAPGMELICVDAKELLGNIESRIGLAVESVPRTYHVLGDGSAVLQRDQKFIYISEEIEKWGDKFCGLVAHELGHWYLDDAKPPITIAHLKTLFKSEGSPALMKVESYGARERQELQSNVFARELLLPRKLAKFLRLKGMGPKEIAKKYAIPLEFVRLQMLDGMLLPEAKSQTNSIHIPSPDQFRAARAEERAANVVAGPGTGKTSTLIYRVKYLIEEKKIEPSQILVLTFTNKAALELGERLRQLGIKQAADVWAGTFHAFGLEFLRKYYQYFGLEPDLQVADKLNSLIMLVAGLPQLNLGFFLRVENPYDWLSPIIDGIKRLKEELVSPEAYREFITQNPDPDEELQLKRIDMAILYAAHERLLAERKMVDFVDLVAKPALALLQNRTQFIELVNRFQYILVDEYQDVTLAMVELLRQLALKSKSIWVVGDIRQAIHHWRGASLKSLLKFDAEFKAQIGDSRIQRYSLDVNRRSSKEILELVEEVGQQHILQSSLPLDNMVSAKGEVGELPIVITCSKHDEILSSVAENIIELQRKGIGFGQQAVLCRWTLEVQKTAEVLALAGVPVIYIGELAQRTEIKHLLCFMQLLVEREPRALIGLVNIPDFQMPMSDIQKLIEITRSDVSYQRGRWLRRVPLGLSEAAYVVISNLNRILNGHNHYSSPWEFICDLVLEHQFGLPVNSDIAVSAWVKRIALWQFAYAVRNGDGEEKEARLTRFLMRYYLRQRIGESYVDRELPPEANTLDGVRILTVHGSKGLEFEATHVAFVNSSSYGREAASWISPNSTFDIVPPEALGSTEAEFDFESAVERNNLLYVALSRTKNHLRIYQDNEFGEDNLAPQLRHFPQKFTSQNYSGSSFKISPPISRNTFKPPEVVKFEHFYTYTTCPLQYWYAYCLNLKREVDIDVSLKANWAVMDALRDFASGCLEAPDSLLQVTWKSQNLPSQFEDPSLWRDASLAYARGLAQIHSIQNSGGAFFEPTSVVGGVTIQMPWGFVRNGKHCIEYLMIRFARKGLYGLSVILKPIIPGLELSGSKKLILKHVISDKSDEMLAAKRISSTKGFKAAVRMLDGDNQPIKGRHCGSCAYMTICPSSPRIT